MPVHLFSPPGMQPGTPYAHVAAATGTRHIHISGQIARDAHGQPVGGDDLAEQVAQVLRNTAVALSAADASFSDVVRMTFYVTKWSPDQLGALTEGIEHVARELGIPQPLPPASLIGVDFLFAPDVRVELETTAIAP